MIFFGNTGQEMKINPMEHVTITLHIPKTAAILNKKLIYFVVNGVKNASGFYQIN